MEKEEEENGISFREEDEETSRGINGGTNRDSGRGKISFNLSPSSINLYYQSPLLFYLTHIAKVPDDTKVPVCYGLSGNLVHDCLEKYANGEFDKDGACAHLLNKWEEYGIDEHKDLKGNSLDPMDYLNAVLKGFKVIEEHENHICEEMISFPLVENDIMKIGIKGIIDLQATKKDDNRLVIIDYKTSNSVSQDKNFTRQALFYNLLIHRKKNIIPAKTSFHYLKLGVSKDYEFSLEDIECFREELNAIADEILSYGTNIEKYPIGEIEDIFNSKKQACMKEVSRRKIYSDRDYVGDLR